MIDFKKEIPTVILILFGTVVCLLVLIQYNYAGNKNIFSTKAAPLFAPTATTTSRLATETITIPSPDGTWKLTMKKQLKGEAVSYIFLTNSNSDNKEQQVFTKTIGNSSNLEIPYNTWSPDNRYIFLKESGSANASYYVFNTDGNPFSDNSQYIDVASLFNLKVTDYSLIEITGWADPNLLIINTKTKHGEQGPSFWFEISSQSFIQLSTHFS